MNDKKKTAWFLFVLVMANFLSNKKADYYKTNVGKMFSGFVIWDIIWINNFYSQSRGFEIPKSINWRTKIAILSGP